MILVQARVRLIKCTKNLRRSRFCAQGTTLLFRSRSPPLYCYEIPDGCPRNIPTLFLTARSAVSPTLIDVARPHLVSPVHLLPSAFPGNPFEGRMYFIALYYELGLNCKTVPICNLWASNLNLLEDSRNGKDCDPVQHQAHLQGHASVCGSLTAVAC